MQPFLNDGPASALRDWMDAAALPSGADPTPLTQGRGSSMSEWCGAERMRRVGGPAPSRRDVRIQLAGYSGPLGTAPVTRGRERYLLACDGLEKLCGCEDPVRDLVRSELLPRRESAAPSGLEVVRQLDEIPVRVADVDTGDGTPRTRA